MDRGVTFGDNTVARSCVRRSGALSSRMLAVHERYIFFHGKRHPAEMGAPEVARFLSSLAVDGHVAASTQNQALSALLFLYREVLGVELPWLDEVVRARRPERLPVVLTRDEVRAVLGRLAGPARLMACLLYGYTHVLNRGPAAVRSPADRMFAP